MKYVFDVDGTLTPSRQQMDEGFASFFREWMKGKYVYFATGSDYPKTAEQIPEDILHSCVEVYCCAGNQVVHKGEIIRESDWQLPTVCIEFLEPYIYSSQFPERTGQHIEKRTGMTNFSVVGRGANMEQRKAYEEFDSVNKERQTIAMLFNKEFYHLGIRAQVAGATGIDIMRDCDDKAQIAGFINGPITFYGDKMEAGGNDFPLAQAIKNRQGSQSIMVTNWKDTYAQLHSKES